MTPIADDPGRAKALAAPFTAMEKAIRESDEALYRAQWPADGVEKNLVGGSGLPGMAVFKQGTRKKWFLKPDLSTATILGEGAAAIVACEIWSWEKEAAKDHVVALVVRTEAGAYVLLGAGENRAQVEALAQRWLKKEPLAPPPSGEKKG